MLHLIVRSTKRQADGAGGIERCEVRVSRVPGAPVGLHDVAHRARRFLSAFSSSVGPSLGIGLCAIPLRSIQCCMARAFAQVVKW